MAPFRRPQPPWTRIAEGAGFVVDRRAPAWGRQYQDIGFSQTDQAAARRAYAAWEQRMESTPPASDCAADALEPEGEWNAYLQAISGFMNGAGLEQTSVADYTAYDAASTGYNWRTPAGYGTVVAASLPHPIDLRLSTPVQSIELDGRGVELTTPVGAVCARAASPSEALKSVQHLIHRHGRDFSSKRDDGRPRVPFAGDIGFDLLSLVF